MSSRPSPSTSFGVLAVALALGIGICLSSCDSAPAGAPAVKHQRVATDGVLTVAVTMAPLAYLADRLLNGVLSGARSPVVITVLPRDANPESWSPTPKDLSRALRADLYVAVGGPDLPLESKHLLPLMHEAGIPIVSLDQTEDANPSLSRAPHAWLSPRLMARIATDLARALIAIDEASALRITSNLETLRDDIDRLDRSIDQRLSDRNVTVFYVDHPAWTHFAEYYGLEQVALERDEKEPTARQLVALLERAKRDRVAVLLVTKGAPSPATATFVHELRLETIELDPLQYDWLLGLDRAADAIAQATPTH